MQAIVTVESGPQKGQRRWIQRGTELTIGTSPFAGFVVDYEGVEPMHLFVRLSEAGCIVQSIGSSPFVHNGLQITNTTVRDGDMVLAGECTFLFRIEELYDEVEAGRNALPQSTQRCDPVDSPQPLAVDCFPIDDDFNTFRPEEDTFPVETMLRHLGARSPLFGLCAFSPWTLQRPDELANNWECVPKAQTRAAKQRLPILFTSSDVADFAELMSQALPAGCGLVLSCDAEFDELLSFLRKEGGLFASPNALQTILQAGQPGAARHLLGPVQGVLFKHENSWEFIGARAAFPSAESLGLHPCSDETIS